MKPLHSIRIDRFCERVSHGMGGLSAGDEKAGAGPGE